MSCSGAITPSSQPEHFVQGELSNITLAHCDAVRRADDYFFYDSRTGNLFYDQDTKGGTAYAAVAFAVIDPIFGITASDLALV